MEHQTLRGKREEEELQRRLDRKDAGKNRFKPGMPVFMWQLALTWKSDVHVYSLCRLEHDCILELMVSLYLPRSFRIKVRQIEGQNSDKS